MAYSDYYYVILKMHIVLGWPLFVSRNILQRFSQRSKGQKCVVKNIARFVFPLLSSSFISAWVKLVVGWKYTCKFENFTRFSKDLFRPFLAVGNNGHPNIVRMIYPLMDTRHIYVYCIHDRLFSQFSIYSHWCVCAACTSYFRMLCSNMRTNNLFSFQCVCFMASM